MRDDDERAVVARERLLELLDRLEVEMVGRLVEDEEVDAGRLQLGQVRARALARGEGRAGPPDVVGPSPNFASSVRASTSLSAVAPA